MTPRSRLESWREHAWLAEGSPLSRVDGRRSSPTSLRCSRHNLCCLLLHLRSMSRAPSPLDGHRSLGWAAEEPGLAVPEMRLRAQFIGYAVEGRVGRLAGHRGQ